MQYIRAILYFIKPVNEFKKSESTVQVQGHSPRGKAGLPVGLGPARVPLSSQEQEEITLL